MRTKWLPWLSCICIASLGLFGYAMLGNPRFPREFAVLGAAIFGITMKIADLLVDDGYKWFPGADILLGLTWGAAGALLAMADWRIANLLVAIVLAFFVRDRIDRKNHGLAAAVMFFVVLFSNEIIAGIRRLFDSTLPGNLADTLPAIELHLNLVGPVFLSLMILGQIEDRITDTMRPGWEKGLLNEICEWRYWLVPLAYSLVSGFWLFFATAVVFATTYEIVRVIAKGSILRGWTNGWIARSWLAVYGLVFLTTTSWLLATGLPKLDPARPRSASELVAGSERRYLIHQIETRNGLTYLQVSPWWNTDEKARVWIVAQPSQSERAASIRPKTEWYQMNGFSIVDEWMVGLPDILTIDEFATGFTGWRPLRVYTVYSARKYLYGLVPLEQVEYYNVAREELARRASATQKERPIWGLLFH